MWPSACPIPPCQPALEQLVAWSSGEGAEVALDPTKKTPAIGSFLGSFPLGRSSERKGLANRLLRGEILVTSFNLSVLQLRMTHSRS